MDVTDRRIVFERMFRAHHAAVHRYVISYELVADTSSLVPEFVATQVNVRVGQTVAWC